jgi:hypothetical protein
MFSELDNIIFPDSCEVIEIVPSQHYVYPIFKCGRSSLTESMQQKGWRFVALEDIKKIKQPITVFLRDPKERFISGLNTFIQHRQGDNLDTHTILYFANKYLFLNRHYAPQFFWLLNLLRYTGPNACVNFQPITAISLLTDLHSRASVEPITPDLTEKMQSFDWSKMELYFYLDQILLAHTGKTVNICDLIAYVKKDHDELYRLIFQRSLNIINVLSKT